MRRRDPARWPVLLGIVLISGLGAAYYGWQQHQAPLPATTEQPLTRPDQQQSVPVIENPIEEARIQHAIAAEPVADSEPTSIPAPSLGQDLAETTLEQAMASIIAALPQSTLILPDDLVYRIVVTIDNLPNSKLTRRFVPLAAVDGALVVAGDHEEMTIGTDNDARYAPHLKLITALDLPTLATLYARHYAQFQQTYVALGDPDAYFNDRLIAVIDHLLDTPEVAPPLAVVQPSVLYKFSDPELEARSAGQKILLRMGQANAEIVKARLRELRHLVARAEAP